MEFKDNEKGRGKEMLIGKKGIEDPKAKEERVDSDHIRKVKGEWENLCSKTGI